MCNKLSSVNIFFNSKIVIILQLFYYILCEDMAINGKFYPLQNVLFEIKYVYIIYLFF